VRTAPWVLLLLALCAGCLPSSCQRTASQRVSPADSLSRQITATIQPDTLHYGGELLTPETSPLIYPRTVRFTKQGGVVVSDAQRNSLFYFDASGAFLREVTWEGASIPYLTGVHGDTAAVFSPENKRIDYIHRGEVVHTLNTPRDLARHALQYAATTRSSAYLKVAGKNLASYLVRMDRQGQVLQRKPLTGNEWYNAGPLRIWGDSLLSFSGFFPAVKIVAHSFLGPVDSLALKGFDSPMLARTYAFTQGDVRGAPLLSSAAAPAGGYLFLLNMRLGWLHIDVYDLQGQLKTILLEPNPGYNRDFYPIDLAVLQRDTTEFVIAVAIIKPEPAIRRYTWSAPAHSNI